MPERKNARRDRRKQKPDGHWMKDRDIRILRVVQRYRVLTVDQIYRLAFYDRTRNKYPNKSVVYARLRRLYDHAYLERDFLAGYGSIQNRKSIYFLALRGAEYLVDKMGDADVDWHQHHNAIGVEYIQHLMLTNEFMSRFEQGCFTDPELELLDFTDERQLKADYNRIPITVGHTKRGDPIVREKALIFDAHIVYRQSASIRHLFLESDHLSHSAGLWQKSDKPSSSFRDKILAVIQGRAYLQQRYNIQGYRMLTITPSVRRTQNLYTVAQKVGGGNIFWFATLDFDGNDDLSAPNIFHAPIWTVCGQAELGVLTGDPKR